MKLSKYTEKDFYLYKHSLKIKKSQTPETMASFLKIWLGFSIGISAYIYSGLSLGYGEIVAWTI